MKFFPSDWRADPALRVCSLAARGLWVEMLCIMHEAEPRGYLKIKDNNVTEAQLAALTGCSIDEIGTLISELETMGVFSRDREGCIYSRRILRDEKKSKTARKNGKSGGNPRLASNGKQKENSALDNQNDDGEVKGQDKTHMPEARSQKPESRKKDDDDSRADQKSKNLFEEVTSILGIDTARNQNWFIRADIITELGETYGRDTVLDAAHQVARSGKTIKSPAYLREVCVTLTEARQPVPSSKGSPPSVPSDETPEETLARLRAKGLLDDDQPGEEPKEACHG